MNRELTFGQLLKEHRKALDLTQGELARRVGCATITLRKIEYDALRPSVQIAERLAMALNIPLEERANFVRFARTAALQTPEPPPTPTPPPLPEEIGGEDLSGRAVRGYELGERIGSGGFGAVYRAVQPGVEREVAVKIILPQYANHPDFIRRFEAEAHLVARLEHPHIVPLYDYWREPNAAFLVMRLLRGGSLSDPLKDGPLPLEFVLRILTQIGGALHTAHRFGVIHRDLKPANILLDEDHNAYLADFGIAKNLGSPNLEDQTQAGAFIGSPAYISPEQIRSESILPQADIYCLGVMLYELLAGQQPFKGPTPIDYIVQHLNQPLPPLAVCNPNAPAALDPIIQRATAKDPIDRYPDVPSLLAEVHAVLEVQTSGMRAGQAIDGDALISENWDLAAEANPFKGLRAFRESDAEDFFGRESFVQELLGRLAEEGDLARFLAVVGPSGSGKSSVVKAGLIPAIRRGALPGSENWFVVDFMPGAHPLEELEAALLRIAVNPPESLLGQLKEEPRGLVRAVKRILPLDEKVELALVIDQFEEVFTLVQDDETRALLLESLLAAVLDERSRIRVILTLRADFTDRPLQYVDFGELLRQRTEFILPLTPDEMEQAIAGPAEKAGLLLEPGLTARIVRELGDQPGTLPLLQYALTELFERRDGRKLTLAAYQAIGGVLGALGRRAEEIHIGLDDAAQLAARQLFLRLVTLGEGVEDTRRRVLRAELASLMTDDWKLNTVITAFGKARLLTFDHDPVTRGPTVEVAHEALLREWPRLRGWLNENRADMRLQRILAGSAAEWTSAGREAGLLLHGTRLSQLEAWAKETPLALTADERAYLTASLEGRKAHQAAELERQEREKSLELRSRKFLQGLVGVFAAAAVVAVLLSIYAINQRDRAESETRIATARELSAAAIGSLTIDPERSIILALQGVLATSTDGIVLPEAEDALHRSVQASHIELNLMDSETSIGDIAYSPDGTSVATAGRTAIIWNSETGEKRFTLSGHSEDVTSVSYNSQGTKLLTSSYDGTAKLWDTQNGALLFTIQTPSPINRAQLSPDGEWLVTINNDRTALVQIWEANSGALINTLSGHTSYLWDVDISPDGAKVATASHDNTAKIWDVTTGKEIFTLEGHTNVISVDFNADGTQLTTSGEDAARIWSTVTGDELMVMRGHTNTITGAAFDPDGSRLATVGLDRQAIIWDIASGMEILKLAGHSDQIWSVAFSPDGTRLATGSDDRSLKIWDLTPDHEVFNLSPGGYVNKASFSGDMNRFVSVSWSDETENWETIVWEISTPFDEGNWTDSPLFKLPEPVSSVAFSPDGITMVTNSMVISNTAKVWSAVTGELLLTLAGGHTNEIVTAAFSSDGTRIATASLDKTAVVWDAATGQQLTRLSSADEIWNAAFSPDGQYLATVGGNLFTGGVFDPRIWDLSTGSELLALHGHSNITYSLAFNPDGTLLATTSRDGSVRVWETGTGEQFLGPLEHGGSVFSVRFSPDGSTFASVGADGTARVWDAVTGGLLLTFAGNSDRLNDVAYSPDGKYLATAGGDGTIRFYLLHIEDLIPLALARLSRWFTPAECLQYLHTETCPPDIRP